MAKKTEGEQPSDERGITKIPNGKTTLEENIKRFDAELRAPQQGTSIASCPTNLNLATLLGRAWMLKASSPSDYDILPGKPLHMIAVAWALIPDTQVNEETGEVSEFVRTVIYDKQGKTFRTSAAHSPMRLAAMLQLFPANEWKEGIPLVIEARQSKRGRVYHDIQIDMGEGYGV